MASTTALAIAGVEPIVASASIAQIWARPWAYGLPSAEEIVIAFLFIYSYPSN